MLCFLFNWLQEPKRTPLSICPFLSFLFSTFHWIILLFNNYQILIIGIYGIAHSLGMVPKNSRGAIPGPTYEKKRIEHEFFLFHIPETKLNWFCFKRNNRNACISGIKFITLILLIFVLLLCTETPYFYMAFVLKTVFQNLVVKSNVHEIFKDVNSFKPILLNVLYKMKK